jgi:hypothetical protein
MTVFVAFPGSGYAAWELKCASSSSGSPAVAGHAYPAKAALGTSGDRHPA